MTKDLAILVGMNQNWMETKKFIKKISEYLSKTMKINKSSLFLPYVYYI